MKIKIILSILTLLSVNLVFADVTGDNLIKELSSITEVHFSNDTVIKDVKNNLYELDVKNIDPESNSKCTFNTMSDAKKVTISKNSNFLVSSKSFPELYTDSGCGNCGIIIPSAMKYDLKIPVIKFVLEKNYRTHKSQINMTCYISPRYKKNNIDSALKDFQSPFAEQSIAVKFNKNSDERKLLNTVVPSKVKSKIKSSN